MSFTAARESAQKHNCQSCRERKARFRFRGRVKADQDHTLCFECFRSARDSRRALAQKTVVPEPRSYSPFGRLRPLTPGGVEHRERMLAYLTTVGR